MKAKDIFLETIKPDGRPERLLKQYEALNMVPYHPLARNLSNGLAPGKTVVNAWGITICWPEGEPGSTPVFDGDKKVLKDITHWRDYVRVPDLQALTGSDEEWEKTLNKARRSDPDNEKLLAGFMGTGIFEQIHFLMGFEDTLTAFYEHPQEMHELIDVITDFRIEYAGILIDKLDPEVMFTHDDWGTRTALFMHEDMWREFFKEPYRRFYGYIRDRGCIAIHHADSYLSPIVEDMAEIGIQVWQGTLPENDIPELQSRLHGSMTLMGGIGAETDTADSSPEEIHEYVRKALAEYAPGGHFIPSITYGLPGSIFPHVDPIIDEEIDTYNSILHMPVSRVAPVRRQKPDSSSADTVQSARDASPSGSDIFAEISHALLSGKKAGTCRLVEEALDRGLDAQTILSDGLIRGMTNVGDAFTAGSIFLPEMLLAAQAMNAATEKLKPLLVASGGTSVPGRVAIGTICGDMHDIGKNLCKLMLEGSGFEVIDLGSNVDNEDFVDAVENRGCNIIAMSALLTTTMPEMKNVIDMLVEKGLRDKVKVMVGGAPVNQKFADSIGADAYTEDAGTMARKAIELVTE